MNNYFKLSCDDSNYGGNSMCGMLESDKRQIFISEKLRLQDVSTESVFPGIMIEDLRVAALQGKAEGWDMLSQGRWHISLPSCQPEDKQNSYCNSKPRNFYYEICHSQRETEGKWLMQAI